MRQNAAAAAAAAPAAPAQAGPATGVPGALPFLILYGGEAATTVAKELAEAAVTAGLPAPTLLSMEEYKSAKIDKTPAKVRLEGV
eukprot:129180-Prorocentrum_minimum.AAC.1